MGWARIGNDIYESPNFCAVPACLYIYSLNWSPSSAVCIFSQSWTAFQSSQHGYRGRTTLHLSSSWPVSELEQDTDKMDMK